MRLALLTLVLALCLVAPAAADRPDSAAPPGASPIWLPEEEWVMERWIPFDSDRLEAVLGVDRGAIYRYLRNGDPTLAQLARSRGVEVGTLAERLLATRRGTVDPVTWATLLERTERMVTQGHLTEHMLGHTFHNWSIMRQTPRLYGMAESERARLYQLRKTPGEMAARTGVGRVRLGRRMLAVLAEVRERAVRDGAMSRAEASDQWERQVEALDPWMDLRPVDGVKSLAKARAASARSAFACVLPH